MTVMFLPFAGNRENQAIEEQTKFSYSLLILNNQLPSRIADYPETPT